MNAINSYDCQQIIKACDLSIAELDKQQAKHPNNNPDNLTEISRHKMYNHNVRSIEHIKLCARAIFAPPNYGTINLTSEDIKLIKFGLEQVLDNQA